MKKQDNSVWYFLFPLIVLAILGIYQCFTMANAANVVDQVPKLIDRATPADSLFATSDVLHAELFDSLIVVTMRVGDKIITDTIWGPGDTTRVLGTMFSDTVRVGGRAYFGWAGHSIFLDSALVDSMVQQTGRFAPGGAGSGDIEGVTAGSGLTGGGITGTVTVDINPGWGLYIHNDSIKVRYTALLDSLTGTDSSAIIYSTDRVQPYSDTGVYIGGTSDEMMMDFTRADTILAFVGVFYGEGVADSMLMSKAWIEGIVGDSVAGKIDGINSSNGITGSASAGVANIQIDWQWLYGFVDTSTAKIPTASLADSTSGGSARAEITKTVAHPWLYGYIDTSRARIPASDTAYVVLHSFLYNYIDTSTAIIPRATLADSTNGGAIRAETVDTSNQHIAVKANIGDSIAAHWAAWVADANVSVRDSLHKYLDTNEALYSKIDTTTAKIPTATLADTTVGGAARAEVTKTVAHPWLYAYIDTSRARIPASDTAYVLLHSFAYNYIDTSSAIIPRATLADSTNGGAIRAEAAKIAYRLTAAQGSANTFGRMVGDSIDVDSIHAGRISIGTDASITDITGDGLAIAAGALTASLGTAITSSEITDGTIALGDMGSNSVDSTKITDGGIGSGDIGTGRITTTHVLDNTLAAADIATGGVATAEILDRTVAAIDIDTSATIKADEFNGNWLTAWPDSTLSLGSGGGLTIGSYIALGSEITDDTALITLPAEWAGAVLSRGYGIDSTKGWDSLDISGGSDIYGNYIEFSKTATTSGVPTAMRRNFQIAIPVPDDADTVYDVSLSYRVFNGTDNESSYVRLKWSTTPFDSAGLTNTYKPSYTDLDSSNSTTFDTLGTDYNRTYVTRGSKIYVLVTALLYDFHTTWARCYDVMVVYRRNRL